eukprot:574924-Rhodomonas_salina.1
MPSPSPASPHTPPCLSPPSTAPPPGGTARCPQSISPGGTPSAWGPPQSTRGQPTASTAAEQGCGNHS